MTPRINVPTRIVHSFVKYAFIVALVLSVFGIILLIAGKDPLRAYADIFQQALFTPYGLSEIIVRMIPLILTAVAVAIPARIGLINIGGEGQFYMGAWLATWGAITFTDLPAWALLPLMCVLGVIGGGAWAAIAGILRAKGWVSETICTLLLNYVAPLVTNMFIVMVLFAAGGLAGLAGMAEVSGMHGRLIQVLSPGYGYMGFLISWLAGGSAIGIVVMSFVLSIIASGGTILQITQGLPYSVINILMALILFIVLARPTLRRK